MNIRKAKHGDEKFLFNLRNEEPVRLASWNSDEVDLETHQKWFAGVLADPNRILYVIDDVVQHFGETSVGQVRYDIRGEIAEVHVSVEHRFFGLGYASKGLRESAKMLFSEHPEVQRIIAHIKQDNVPSLKAFAKAGYKYGGIVPYKKIVCVEMTLARRT
ncbi:GNAT family N-acetyltransferase [Candidatus Giovannonibacteria bacterium]|nr:GNAT family N-acetyltransferase [Candidatus Giovannonibacteria bacterium]